MPDEWPEGRQILGSRPHQSRCRLLPNRLRLAKVLDMLPRTLLFRLLAASLLALPSYKVPILPTPDLSSQWFQASTSYASWQNSKDDEYSLRGTVVNSLTGEPIRGALVQIYFNGQSSVFTGPDGKFQFDGLPFGQTSITVRKPGFFSEDDFEPSTRIQRQAATGPKDSLVVFTLIPEGVIYGRISEEDGEPIEGLPVEMLVQQLQNGRKTWQQRPGTVTDEVGNFRFAELLPGNYFLSAGPSRNPLTFPAKLSQPGARGIPLVYYPVGSELAAAAPISITPGKKAEINLTLSPQPFYRVSGTISGYASSQSVGLQLSNSAGIPLTYASRFDSASGSFRILWASAGTYTLHAESPDGHGHSLSATVPLTVNADLSGVHVILLPTVTIPIEMHMITSRTGAERFWDQENYFPASVQLVARNAGLFELRYGSQQVGERGALSLELQNIVPGTYGVEVNPNGPLYVQSAMSGTTNLLESDLSIAPGSSPQPIEITLRDDVASLSGNVSVDNHPQSATILAFSEHASTPPRIQPTDQAGSFQLPFLPPGTFKVVAVDHPDRLEYANPEALKKYLSRAREVTLSPDQSAKIDLELVKVGE
jgi:Carboxypeptidase regulatory-like domain